SWAAEHPEQYRESQREHSARRRARLRGNDAQPVKRREVYERYGGCCGICGAAVSFRAMELDHIVPVSRGGAHRPDNVQPSHKLCNRRKFNRLTTEPDTAVAAMLEASP